MKKLQLNKRTIASLSASSMQSVKGGANTHEECGPNTWECDTAYTCPRSQGCQNSDGHTHCYLTAFCPSAGCDTNPEVCQGYTYGC